MDRSVGTPATDSRGMKHPGPLFTLLAGVLLAAGIAVANAVTGSPPPVNTAGGAPAPAASSTAAPTSTAATSTTKAPEAPARADYAGHVDGGGASVAVSVRDGHAIAYVCDGKKTEAWLQGATAAGRLDLKDAKGGSLVGGYDAAAVTGTVAAGGKTWHFTARPVTKPSGVYRATPKVKGKPARVGWIVLPDGSQVGILTADESTAAPALDPAARTATVDGSPVTAESISGLSGEGDF